MKIDWFFNNCQFSSASFTVSVHESTPTVNLAPLPRGMSLFTSSHGLTATLNVMREPRTGCALAGSFPPASTASPGLSGSTLPAPSEKSSV